MKDDFKENFPEISHTLDIIGGKWKIMVLWTLKNKAKRFSDLKSEVGGITQKMLSQSLKELAEHGIITRKSFNEIPPRVEYKLTDTGKTLIPVIDSLHNWGKRQIETSGKLEETQLGLFN